MRAQGLIVASCVVSGLVGLIALAGAIPTGPAGGRAVAGLIGVAGLVVCLRLALAGLRLEPYTVTVRGLTTTDRIPRADVLGLAIQPAAWGRLRRLAVVCADGYAFTAFARDTARARAHFERRQRRGVVDKQRPILELTNTRTQLGPILILEPTAAHLGLIDTADRRNQTQWRRRRECSPRCFVHNYWARIQYFP